MLFRILPRPISILPYKVCYRSAQLLLSKRHVQIWTRNSYALNLLLPGISDIDFTFFFWTEATKKDIKETIQRAKKFRLFFPLWGEINSYHQSEIPFFLSLLNPLEKERDPTLNSFYPKAVTPSLEERFVFMVRMLKADSKNLLLRPHLRERKWRYHSHQAQISYSTSPQENVINELLIPLKLNLNVNILNDFLKIDESKEEVVNHFYLPLDEANRRSFILLFPMRWLVVSLRNNQFENDIKIIQNFQIKERQLLYKHLSWEVWGIFSQYPELALVYDLDCHLENIAKIISFFQDSGALELQTAIKNLRSLIKAYRQE